MHIKSLFPPIPPTPDKNLYHLLFEHPEQLALPDTYTIHIDALTGKSRTRREFNERVRDAATALAAPVSEGGLGLSGDKGDIVGIFSMNCMDYVTLANTLLAITTPYALISAFSTPFELVHALKTSKATCLFVHPSLLSKARIAAREVGLPQERIFILEGTVEGSGTKNLEDLIATVKSRNVKRQDIRPAKKDTLAYLVFSSGTSGLPKAVMISHGNVWAMIHIQVVVMVEERKQQRVPPSAEPSIALAFLPFYHSYGFQTFCIRGLLGLTTIVIFPRWDLKGILRSIPRFKINILFLIPSALHQMANSAEFSNADLSSVTVVSSGAAYLPPQLAERVVKKIPQISSVSEGYGLSECTLSALRKPSPGLYGLTPIRGSTGILLPGLEAKILRDDLTHCDVDEPGELWLKGDNVALGYFGNEQATKDTFFEGDRAKDTLKVSGTQVSPTEIEQVLRQHPKKLVEDVCVAGVAGHGRTSDEKVPRAWVVLSEQARKLFKENNQQEVLNELEDWTKKNLSSYKWLRGGLEVIDEIPKNPTGKVLRRVLQERYEISLKKSKAHL
ncbi:hypothetical protein C8Q75DRAFT_333646 [Abortiporus biennis]|nr:hypothetical protein C8Q75DRAFT_333646 [Abortiporus biennis]